MYKYLIYTAFGWLVFTGVAHFIVDVISQHLRGKRAPSLETSLYYGLNSAYALGQVAFGILGLYVAWRAMPVIKETPAILLCLAIGLGWLAISLLFMDYWEPKFNASVFCILIIACFTAR